MGEGAALLVLEAADVAEARGAVPYAELMGYGATSDAHHMVQPRADGTEAARAATIALDDAGVDPGEIDYVNAHASSTPIGDVAEARAIALALGERAATVPVSGTKALYGHPLGASGAIEAAICALAIRDGWAPASVNLFEPDPEIATLLPGLLRRVATGPIGGCCRPRSGSVGSMRRWSSGPSTAEARAGERASDDGSAGLRAFGEGRGRHGRTPTRGRTDLGNRPERGRRAPDGASRPATRPRRSPRAHHRPPARRRSRRPRPARPSRVRRSASNRRIVVGAPCRPLVGDGELDREVLAVAAVGSAETDATMVRSETEH